MPNQNSIKSLDIKALLNGDDQYVIPIYQRNYAWGSKEIEQLIQDIIDYSRHHKNKNYYIGTLVVAPEKSTANNIEFYTIDGQQRLTTLTILSTVIKNQYKAIDLSWFNNLNLHFSSRLKSMISLEAALNGKFVGSDDEVNIKAAYEICHKELDVKIKEHEITIEAFAEYLYGYVKILRVPLPDKIDLNHYFEIMNSRGEQLEKHEILKAKLMGCFKSNENHTQCFDLIWEACSNMEKYVQYGFTPTQRHLIFGLNNWNELSVFSFDEFESKIFSTLSENADIIEQSIEQIIPGNKHFLQNIDSEEPPDRFNSVVNFQNFLLHVLRIQTSKEEVALDDKRLLEIFDNELPQNEQERITFVKKFIYNLLKCKFLFDKYIIKREFLANSDKWSLKCINHYSSGKVKNSVTYVNTFGNEQNESFDTVNRRVLMLLSMFHVSIPSISYKYWLTASLNYLFHQVEIECTEYIQYLEHIAKSFVFDRYLSINPMGYQEMIFTNLSPISRKWVTLDLNKLKYGKIENNLIFNFCDYFLWLKYKDHDKDTRVKTFEFTFRSSVEHFYPQHPINEDIEEISEEYLHSFGNLCLISHEKNSRLNNFSPIAKKDHYSKSTTIDSLKQFEMMKPSHWDIKDIQSHEKEMYELLRANINSNYNPSTQISLAKKWFKEYQLNDRELLVRTLLIFGDCTKHINGDRYYLYDFHFIRNHEAFSKFEQFVEINSTLSLPEIIQSQLTNENLQNDYRYLFVKYPEVVNFCKEGNFQWFEDSEGKLIYLLEGEKRTEYKARELFTFLLCTHFENILNLELYSDYEGFSINIGFENDEYYITNLNDPCLQLQFWNENGIEIKYLLKPLANGNYTAIKRLQNFSWEKVTKGDFLRFGKDKLLKLDGNFEEIIQTGIEEIKKLLKNGFKIKI